jgi:hypothetical protein
MGWLKDTLTGADGETVAIGRVIGMLIAIVLLIMVPITAVIATVVGKTIVTIWTAFFPTLGGYVVMVTAAIGGLIWGTNGTEPKS